jgi:hypothetical protein
MIGLSDNRDVAMQRLNEPDFIRKETCPTDDER